MSPPSAGARCALLTPLVREAPHGRGSCTIRSAVCEQRLPAGHADAQGARLEAHVVIADVELDDRPHLLLDLRAEVRDQADRVKVAGCGLVRELTRGNLDAGHRLALAILGHGHLAVQRLQDGRWHALVAGATPATIARLPFLEAAVDRRSAIADLVAWQAAVL